MCKLLSKSIAVAAFVVGIGLTGPSLAASPQWSWTGFYAGLNAGGAVTRNHTRDTDVWNETPGLPIGLINPGLDGDTFTHAQQGAIFGGQIGYNRQFAPYWVAGVEADWQWTRQKDTACVAACLQDVGFISLLHTTDEQSVHWLATVRGRLGWIAPNGTLLYGTGGFAAGRIKQILTSVAAPGYFATGNTTSTGVFSHDKTGYALGAGAEMPIWNAWSIKIEYLYVDLGKVQDSFTTPVTPAIAFVDSQTNQTNYKVHDHIVRVGVNYNFGQTGAMAAMAYAPPPAPVRSWAGFYAGLNAGAALARNPTHEPLRIPTNPFPVWGDDTFNSAPEGAIFGGQIGYNWQIARQWLVGAEADMQWSGQRNLACISECFPEPLFFAPGAPGVLQGLYDQQNIKWFGTARGRIGWIPFNNTLVYATGGLAWGKIDQTLTMFADAPGFFANGVTQVPASFSHVKVGWTVGGGIETPVWNNWSIKVEYLYIDLGSTTNSYSAALDPVQIDPAIFATSVVKIRDHVARLGVNYKFN